MPVTLLGIRHHGPGSCRHVVEYLQALKPDLILLEAPSDVAPLLNFVPTLTQAQQSPLPPPMPEAEHDQAHAQSQAAPSSKKAQDAQDADKDKYAAVAELPELLRPPVALMAYQSDKPSNAAFYPFAEFSPEWQTMLYGKEHGIEVRPFDLPLSYSLAVRAEKMAQAEAAQEAAAQAAAQAAEHEAAPAPAAPSAAAPTQDETPASAAESEADAQKAALVRDPFDYLAQLEGLQDGEQWWENRIEQRCDSKDIFAAVELAVSALREALPEHSSDQDLMREAWMRKELRAAIKDANALASARAQESAPAADAAIAAVEPETVAEAAPVSKSKAQSKKSEGLVVVVCGAWHVPALKDLSRYKVKDDNALLKTLPKPLAKNKVGITWIPWTYGRLSYYSGYGAGINAPGWYHHMFLHPDDDGTLWLTHVASVLRQQGYDISVAHVMEAVRLARTLAALRQLEHPSLAEFNEAVTTVMGMGDDIILRSVASQLVIADRLGTIPSTVPMVPLLADITALQKHLRQPFVAGMKDVVLDLRKPLDLERSIFFHRLRLLGLDWAKEQEVSGQGTFKEGWQLNYRPEHVVVIVEHAVYGNTLVEAVTNYVTTQMREHPDLEFITKTLEQVMACDLPDLVAAMSVRINDLATQTTDLLVLLKTVAPLCSIVRYGNVRKFDFSSVRELLETMLVRIRVGGLLLCCNINDDAARSLKQILVAVNVAIATLNNEACNKIWQEYIAAIQASSKVHPLLSGATTRLMRDHHTMTNELILQALSYYSSVGNTPNEMAFWFEGFLENSGTVLLLDDVLWGLVNDFMCGLDEESFQQILPIMRRTFSTFEQHERTQLGQKAKDFDPEQAQEAGTTGKMAQRGDLPDDSYARPVIGVVAMLLGLNLNPAATMAGNTATAAHAQIAGNATTAAKE